MPVPPNRRVSAPKRNRSKYIPADVPRVRSEASISTQSSLRIFAPHEKELISPKERAQLRGVETALAELRAEVGEKYGHWSARNAFRAAQNQYRADPSKENLQRMGSLSRIDGLSEENARIRQTLKSGMRELGSSVLPIIRSIYDRAGTIIGKEIAAVAEKERALSNQYGLEKYVPSPIIGALENFADRLERPVSCFGFDTPRTLLFGILKL